MSSFLNDCQKTIMEQSLHVQLYVPLAVNK